MNNADNRIVAIVNPEIGLFDEPTIPAIYAAIEENKKAINKISSTIANV